VSALRRRELARLQASKRAARELTLLLLLAEAALRKGRALPDVTTEASDAARKETSET
jgi:hypothetical protein